MQEVADAFGVTGGLAGRRVHEFLGEHRGDRGWIAANPGASRFTRSFPSRLVLRSRTVRVDHATTSFLGPRNLGSADSEVITLSETMERVEPEREMAASLQFSPAFSTLHLM